MKRQKETIGSILEIKLEDKFYTYAQILDGGTAFFDYKTSTPLKDLSILNNVSILFIVTVYKDVITHGIWMKVGKIPIREELKILPLKFIHHKDENPEFELYNPNTGEIIPSTKEACKGLEVSAVHEAHHIEERLNDHFEGRVNAYRQEKLDIFKD